MSLSVASLVEQLGRGPGVAGAAAAVSQGKGGGGFASGVRSQG